MRIRAVFFFLILFCNGCNKDEIIEPKATWHFPLNRALVEQYLYQPGTWWVYRDLSDNSRDSIFVQATNYSIYKYSQGPSGPGQGPRLHEYAQYEMVLGGDVHETSKYLLETNYFRTNFSLPMNVVTVFGYNELTDSTVMSETRIDFYDSLLIQSVWYSDIAKVRVNSNAPFNIETSGLDIYYISKEFGIIKKEIANTDSTYKIYELINSNIVK